MKGRYVGRTIRQRGGMALAVMMLASCARPGAAPLVIEERFTRWATYEGDNYASHFSALDQINRTNVTQLQVAWTYPMGDNTGSTYNPIVIDSILYTLGRENSIVAVHAGNGREIWRNPLQGVGDRLSDRGLMYWENADRTDRRIYTSKGNFLHAMDALTGRTIPTFGVNGKVDLGEGLGRDPKLMTRAQSDSPGRVFEDLIILGSATGESYAAAPGHIRAYDARTGRMVWIFHTIPQPGEYGYDTWPADAWQRVGGTNAWGGLSLDDKRGIVYVPLGSASYDFYGADRIGANLFANSIVALNARTGERLWHYQTVHHDLWDYDLTATPTLMTIRKDGRARDVVVVASKQGYVFVFDRVTGEPIWPIEERPVPASDMPGEQAWPTQPAPTWPQPFAVQSFGVEDINPYLPQAEQDSIRRRLGSILNLQETVFQPPSTRPTMQMPGNSGGANWGSTAADPTEGAFYVVTKNLPTVLTLERILPGVFGTGTTPHDRGQFVYQQNCQACHQPNRQGQPPLIPSLEGVTTRLTAAQITQIVQEGKGNMPGFPDLATQDINGIIAYLENPAAASAPSSTSAQAASEGDSGPVRYQTGYGYFSASGGMYARKPPFSTLTKYDMNTGAIAWQIPVGEVPSLLARGITDNTGGSSVAGGPTITAGGLIFLATQDKLRAYDKADGKLLWSGQLPSGGAGIPTVYELNGRQYVVMAAASGGGGGQGQPSTRAYVAFALPQGVR